MGTADVNGDLDMPARYAALVQSYLNGDGETALHGAYQLGREALDSGLGPLVLFSIHRDVLNSISAPLLDPGELTSRVTTVFIETLAPFQMAYTGLDEAHGAAADLGSLINGQAGELRGLDEQLDSVARTGDTLLQLRSMLQRHLTGLDRVRGRLQDAQQEANARRQMISNIVSAQEQERRRLAVEIHDDALQAMAAVLLRLGIVRMSLASPDQGEVLADLEGTTRDAITRLRRLLAGLAPQELERAGLAVAIGSALEAVESDFGICCRFVDNLSVEPGPEARTIAFRIVQEALANARNHANASNVEVLLESRDHGLLVRVIDDGIGFDVESAGRNPAAGHLGISSMRERARLAGGWLTIHSRCGQTSLEAWIPDTSGGIPA